MAIALDRCIQRTCSTATHNFERSPSLGETVVLEAKPAGLWHTGSNYVPLQPSPVDDTKSSVTQQISSPSIEISLLDDFCEFIKARGPGTYKKFYPVTLNDFLSLKNKLDIISEISYIHIAQARTLFIMVCSDGHEIICVAVCKQLTAAMVKQKGLNPPLAEWELHTNRSHWFNDADNQHVPDMTLCFRCTALLCGEFALTQPWDILRCKIDQILLDKDVRGVLVIKLIENSEKWTYSKPTRVANYNNFITFDNFDARMQRAQTANKYGALLMVGWEWMGKVTCEVYFFPGEWEVGFANMQAYSLNRDSGSFTDLNVQLAKIWSDIVQDIGRQLSCLVDLIELSIDWHELNKKAVKGL